MVGGDIPFRHLPFRVYLIFAVLLLLEGDTQVGGGAEHYILYVDIYGSLVIFIVLRFRPGHDRIGMCAGFLRRIVCEMACLYVIPDNLSVKIYAEGGVAGVQPLLFRDA